MPGWAEKRAEGQRKMEEIVPGSGFGVRMDRGAWAASGGTEPGKWSWPRALLQVALAFGGLLLLGLVVEVEPTVFVGLGLAYVFLIIRGYQVHRRYLERHSPNVP